ncbi:SRPBCC family protein [Nocardia gipuzkoensis]|uniref:SRPBCC family protein n=1 Tax=Nocardia gipuzkoensis TaxID=2749991 RepID=UPI00237D662F|nr:SRPBCC family protein [Nocardia gipuzkoensis]MDE1675381.1 SRPBCC family protein [Nocardia gipuzkoensis]
MDSDVRFLTMPSGAVVRELIVTVDNAARRMAYSAVEGFSLPVRHHHASFQVFPESEGRARLVWITDVLPHDVVEEVRPRIRRGLEVMRESIEKQANR